MGSYPNYQMILPQFIFGRIWQPVFGLEKYHKICSLKRRIFPSGDVAKGGILRGQEAQDAAGAYRRTERKGDLGPGT